MFCSPQSSDSCISLLHSLVQSTNKACVTGTSHCSYRFVWRYALLSVLIMLSISRLLFLWRTAASMSLLHHSILLCCSTMLGIVSREVLFWTLFFLLPPKKSGRVGVWILIKINFNCWLWFFSLRPMMTAHYPLDSPDNCQRCQSSSLKDLHIVGHHATQKEIFKKGWKRCKCQPDVVPHYHCKGTGRDLL